MKLTSAVIIRKEFLLLLVAATAMGCAASPEHRFIATGDPVRVDYTCHLPNGELAATTDKTTAEDFSVAKSALYLSLKQYGPISLTAGSAPAVAPSVRGFDDEIAARLAAAVPGMQNGERKSLELKDELVPGRVGDERFLRLARVRTRPREMRLSRQDYVTRSGKEPEVGRPFVIDPAMPGQVEEVSDKEVVIRFQAPQGGEIRTPFGAGKVRDAGDHYEIAIDARPGSLVRSGPLVGRISEVNDRLFTVDYGYQFGGETLRCDIRAEVAGRDDDKSRGIEQ